MPTAVIAEDEDALRRELREQLRSLWPDLAVVGEARNGLEAVEAIARNSPDVVFLDIRLPGMSGIDVAETASGKSHVVFVTAHQEYAATAYDQGAVDYIVKPLEAARLAKAVGRLKERLGAKPADIGPVLEMLRGAQKPGRIRWVQGSIGNKIKVIDVAEVLYFQAEAKYTKVVAEGCELFIRRTLKELVESLDPETFWQVSRGAVINVARIEEVRRDGDSMFVSMRGHDTRIAVTSSYQHHFRKC